jgi:hypothetical protein
LNRETQRISNKNDKFDNQDKKIFGETMSVLISLVGVVFLVAGLLSIAKITNVVLDFISLSKIHLLPFLATYPSAWVYVVLGVILLVIAAAVSRRG